MTRRPAASLLTFLAALVIALASVLSAAFLAPDRGEHALMASTLATGIAYDDICGDPGGDHDHHCPFCRLLPDAPDMRPVFVPLTLAYAARHARLADLTHPAQVGNPNVSARAPPAMI